MINNELRLKMEKTLSVIGHNLMVVNKSAFEKVRQRKDEESSTSSRFSSNLLQLASSESEDFY